jgi:3-deoxy-D-manno-octulosonic-acid transferase
MNGIMYLLYTLVLILCGCGLVPRLLWCCLRGADYHQGLLARLGYGGVMRVDAAALHGCLWFHAASVGEAQGLQPIIACLHARFPTWPVIVSTFTPTGKAMAQSLIPEAVVVFLLPFDVPCLMRRLVRHLRPRALIVQETELWPHLFRAVARRHVPLVVVNGRLSPRSFRRYLCIRMLMRRLLADVTLLLVQSHEIAQRFVRLGAIESRLRVVGNTNIDRALHAAQMPVQVHPLAAVVQGHRVLVAGSTHEGEEAILLAVYRRLRQQYPELLLVLAPRHLHRVDTVIRQVQAHHYRAVRRSQCEHMRPTALQGDVVLVLDTLGELAGLYRLSVVAFVGGSFVPIGGHNILEPAVYAKPLFFGPYMQHYPELAQMLCSAGGAIQVTSGDALYRHLAHLLRYPHVGDNMGQRALQALVAHRGALQATDDIVTTLLQQEDSPCPRDSCQLSSEQEGYT